MKPNTKIVGVAVAVTLGLGGAVVVDQTQAAIPLECVLTAAPVQNLDHVVKEYKVDEGFLVTREMTTEDRGTIKGCEIAKVLEKKKIRRESIELEIVGVEPISGGVQVFVRAWKNGTQIGFGKDGTVDIERFRLINPPIVVSDPLGEIINESLDEEGNLIVSRGREDLQEAILLRLEGAIQAKKEKSLKQKIIVGKVGNTTTVVDYTPGSVAAAGESAHVAADGKASYTLARDTATADASYLTTTNSLHNVVHNSRGGSNEFYVRRADFQFVTSSIPDSDVVSAASITINIGAAQTVNADTDTIVLLDNTSNGNLSDPLATEDMNDFTSTSIGSETIANLDSDGNHAISLTDFTAISKTGTTRIGMRTQKDIDNTSPTGFNVIRVRTGTQGDNPFLTVEHAAGPDRRIIRTTPQ